VSLQKWLAISAGFAFVLSLSIGLLSGVNFLAALFRAVIGGAEFSGLVYGLYAVVKKYLPELLSAAESGRGDIRGEAPEGTVNIIVDDTPEFAGVQTDAEAEELGGDESSGVESSEDDSFGSRPEEVSEADFGDEFVEEVQKTGEAVSGSPGTRMRDISEGLELEDVDELPDLESFEGSFVPSAGADIQEAEGGNDLSDSPRPSRGGGSIDVMGEEHDTESIAKAVRTILKKDREG